MKMGILVVNKAKGMTSHDVVAILRRKLNIKKVGHTGTLDPMATGVLPICIGNATRVSDYIMNQGKSYIATLKFGEATTTYDFEGEITNKSDNKIFQVNEVKNVLEGFKGIIEQTPPIYSALKVNGKKLYQYAREGKEVESRIEHEAQERQEQDPRRAAPFSPPRKKRGGLFGFGKKEQRPPQQARRQKREKFDPLFPAENVIMPEGVSEDEPILTGDVGEESSLGGRDLKQSTVPEVDYQRTEYDSLLEELEE